MRKSVNTGEGGDGGRRVVAEEGEEGGVAWAVVEQTITTLKADRFRQQQEPLE